jgi:hypothetical protein
MIRITIALARAADGNQLSLLSIPLMVDPQRLAALTFQSKVNRLIHA